MLRGLRRTLSGKDVGLLRCDPELLIGQVRTSERTKEALLRVPLCSRFSRPAIQQIPLAVPHRGPDGLPLKLPKGKFVVSDGRKQSLVQLQLAATIRAELIVMDTDTLRYSAMEIFVNLTPSTVTADFGRRQITSGKTRSQGASTSQKCGPTWHP